jgi:hypothetical protein
MTDNKTVWECRLRDGDDWVLSLAQNPVDFVQGWQYRIRPPPPPEPPKPCPYCAAIAFQRLPANPNWYVTHDLDCPWWHFHGETTYLTPANVPTWNRRAPAVGTLEDRPC